jgi:hypothetical protein
MSSQGVMFSKQDNNNPGLCPIKDNNRALVARSGPEINSLARLCVLQGPRHNTRRCFPIQHFIFLLIFCLETPQETLRSNKPLNRTISCELVGDFISLHSGMPYFMGSQMTIFVNTAPPPRQHTLCNDRVRLCSTSETGLIGFYTYHVLVV